MGGYRTHENQLEVLALPIKEARLLVAGGETVKLIAEFCCFRKLRPRPLNGHSRNQRISAFALT